MLENFCRVTAFDEIITKDTGMLLDSSIIRVLMTNLVTDGRNTGDRGHDQYRHWLDDFQKHYAFQLRVHSFRLFVSGLIWRLFFITLNAIQFLYCSISDIERVIILHTSIGTLKSYKFKLFPSKNRKFKFFYPTEMRYHNMP